jgi:prefoldin subunit 5
MPPEDKQEGEKQGVAKYRWWIVGGVAIIILIAVVALRGNSSSTGTPSLTLESVNSHVQTLTTNVTYLSSNLISLQATSALRTETIGSLISDVDAIKARLSTLEGSVVSQSEVDQINANLTTLQGTLSTLMADITRLEALAASASSYVSVSSVQTDVSPAIIVLTISKAGNYSVLLNVYGHNLTNIEARVAGSPYSIVGPWGAGDIIVASIQPTTEWVAGESIELKVTGEVGYVSTSES